MTDTARETENDSRSLEQLIERGRQLVRAGDVKTAARIYQVACLRNPFEADPWVGLGLCQKRLGDLRAADLAFSIAEALGADHPGLLAHRAECRIRQGKLDLARVDLEAAIAKARELDEPSTLDRALHALEWLERQGVTS